MDFDGLLKFDEFLSDLKTTPTASFLKDNSTLAALASGSGPMARGSAFHSWLLKNWPMLKDRHELMSTDGNVKDAANALQMALKDPEGFGQGIPLERWVQNLLDWMEKFVAEANTFLAQMTDERFTYKGLKVLNPDRLPEPVVRKLLSGIDYVLALFKKRGVTPLLGEVLDKVILRHSKPEDEGHSGWYHWSPTGGTITMISDIVEQKSARFLSEWINEVFLHEVGHLVHLNLMDREARKEWNSGWAPVEQAKKDAEAVDEKIRKVAFDERKRYWDLILDAKADLKKIRLKGLDRMKFHAWLAWPQLGGSLVTPKNLKWSKDGEGFRDFIADPESYVRKPYGDSPPSDVQDLVNRRFKVLKEKMGVDTTDTGTLWPILSPEQVKEYAAQDSLVEKAIDALEVPSSYARTNEKEDFAESFVAYMDAPEKLSKQAKFRMQRALHLSGLYGKPIMKTVAKLVAEARALLASVDGGDVIDDPMEFQTAFVAEHPQVKPLLRLFKGTKRGMARGTEVASYEGGFIILKEAFYDFAKRHGPKMAEHIFAHEMGHVLETETFKDIDTVGVELGINVWDGKQLPLGTSNFSEGVAETFAVLVTRAPDDLRLLRSRWPLWEDLVIRLAAKVGVRFQ